MDFFDAFCRRLRTAFDFAQVLARRRRPASPEINTDLSVI
jgi:hypothetical protein